MATTQWYILWACFWCALRKTEADKICIFIRSDQSGKDVDNRMAQAVQDTWGPEAVMMHGGGAGFQQFGHHLSQVTDPTLCTWFLLVPSLNTYVNVPVLSAMLQYFNASQPTLLNLGQDQATSLSSATPYVVSAILATSCGNHIASAARTQCLENAVPCHFHELVTAELRTTLVDINGWNSFSLRDFNSCLLSVFNVRGWVHLYHIHDVVEQSGGMGKCGVLHEELASSSVDAQGSFGTRCGLGRHHVITAQQQRLTLKGDVCIFVPVPLGHDSDVAAVDNVVSMVLAASSTWATNNTVFVLPPVEEEPLGLAERLAGVQLSQLVNAPNDQYEIRAFRGLLLWKHALRIARGGSCKWVMKVPLWSYVQAVALEKRLACFDPSSPWFLGVTTAAYSPGIDPFLFPSNIAGAILSRGLFDNVIVWADFCLSEWAPDMGSSAVDFMEDYAFALCLNDLGKVQGKNYADIDTSFIMVERPSRTLELFTEHSDTVKQCLLVVGTLGSPEDLRVVHEWLTWSQWHQAVPCIGESSFSKYSIADGLGNKQPYFDEAIRLAIYYCKDPKMLEIETELSTRLAGKDPRTGRGNPNGTEATSVPTQGRQHLCIFVPSSARDERFVRAAEVAWENWGTVDTYFVAPTRLSALLDPQTLQFDLDVDTDYAHLPVRTFRLFEALGDSEWAHACDWYMKADADSYMNVPLIADRLRCFDPGQFWFMGLPQIAHGNQGTTTRFASGGAGYAVSRALLPKLAAWSPFCLLQLLQHSGGTGMEDVSLSGCIWKWGRIRATSYLDAGTEVITSEARLNSTNVRTPGSAATTPPCTFVVHSLRPEEVPIARENVQKARDQASPGLSCRPDAEMIRSEADKSYAPLDWGDFSGEPQWDAYDSREMEALISCSSE